MASLAEKNWLPTIFFLAKPPNYPQTSVEFPKPPIPSPMKAPAHFLAAVSAFGVITLCLPDTAQAQEGQGPIQVKVGKIEVALQKTPRITVEGGTKEKRDTQREWLEIEVEFEAQMKGKDDYINELEFAYSVYFDNGDKARAIYTASVTHINIPKDETTFSSIYVSPTVLGKIFGKDKTVNPKDVWVAVEIKSQGALKGGDTNHKSSPPWWQSANAARMDGMLLNKSQTPFAFLWWDRYPEVRAQR